MAGPSRIDELRKKFDENPRRYFAPLANEYRKLGDYEQAIFICQEFLPQQPGHMSGHIVYGQALFEASRHDEARTVFETALSLDPENLIALRHLGDIARAHGDTETARAWYRRVLDSDPRNEDIAGILAALDSDPVGAAPTVAGGAPPVPSGAPATSPTSDEGAPASVPSSGGVNIPGLPMPGAATEEGGTPAAARPSESPAFSPLAGFGAASHDSVSATGGFEQEADLDSLFPTGATAAGGNMYQDAPPLEAPPEPTAVESLLDVPSESSPSAAFVTETMAELYLQQGHRDEALSVYRQLVALHPHDEALRERIRMLELPPAPPAATAESEPVDDTGPTIRDFLAALALCRPRATAVAAPAYEAAPATHTRADAIADASPPSSARTPPPAPRTGDSVSGSLDALFAGAEGARRETARSPLEVAFSADAADRPERKREDDASAPLRGRPATPAATELSLDHVFRRATPGGGAQAQGGFSFDQFFSQQAQNDAATPTPEPARESASSESDDIQQFNAWLEGLKKS